MYGQNGFPSKKKKKNCSKLLDIEMDSELKRLFEDVL